MLNVTAIIPAYNEAENIALVVGGLRALRKPSGLPAIHEVIVADNNSDDDTAAIALQHVPGLSTLFKRATATPVRLPVSTQPATCCCSSTATTRPT